MVETGCDHLSCSFFFSHQMQLESEFVMLREYVVHRGVSAGFLFWASGVPKCVNFQARWKHFCHLGVPPPKLAKKVEHRKV